MSFVLKKDGQYVSVQNSDGREVDLSVPDEEDEEDVYEEDEREEIDLDLEYTQLSNGQVLVTIAADNKINLISGWSYVDSTQTKIQKEYDSVVKEEVTVTDSTGNSDVLTINTTNYISTILNVTYGSYRGDVTIKSNMEILLPEGWEYVDSGHTIIRKHYGNGNTIEIVRIVNKQGKISYAEVNTCAETAPKVKLEYIRDSYGIIEARLSADGEIWNWENVNENSAYRWRYMYKADGNYDRTKLRKYYDSNNKTGGEIIIRVGGTNIHVITNPSDEKAPILNLRYEEVLAVDRYGNRERDRYGNYVTNVKATITSDEEIKLPKGWKYVTSDGKTVYNTIKLSDRYDSWYYDYNRDYEEFYNKEYVNTQFSYMTDDEFYTYIRNLYRDYIDYSRYDARRQLENFLSERNNVNKKRITKEYEHNRQDEVQIYDLNGNVTYQKIDTSDITPPRITIDYNLTEDKKAVEVTIQANEQIEQPSGWELDSTKTKATKKYTKNKSETVVISDLVGNKTTAKINASMITQLIGFTPSSGLSGDVLVSNMQLVGNNINAATVFTTDDIGRIRIVNLLTGTYEIEEVGVGDLYYGYELDPAYRAWNIDGSGTRNTGTISVNIDRQLSTQTNSLESNPGGNKVFVYNQKKYVKISGYVWEDIQGNVKDGKTNSVYDEKSEDLKLAGIRVNLRKTGGALVDTKVTSTGGEYIFEDILINDLTNYYIEFEYDGEIFTTVKSFKELGSNSTNTSKAVEDENKRKSVNEAYGDVSGKNSGNINGTEAEDSTSKIKGSRGEFEVGYELKRDNPNTDASAKVENEIIYEGQIETTITDGTKYRNVYEFKERYTTTENKDGKEVKTDHKGYKNYEYNKVIATTQAASNYNVLGAKENTGINTEVRDSTGNITGEGEITAQQIRQNDITVLSNRNCGLVKREQVNLSISVDLENVIVSVNGYNNTYQYGQGANYPATNVTAEGDVKSTGDYYRLDLKDKKWGYTRSIYASDIVFDGEKSCQVFLTYKISVNNSSNTLAAQVTDIANYYDAEYERGEYKQDSAGIWVWQKAGDDSSAGSGLKVHHITSIPKVNAMESQSAYVQFKVNGDKVRTVLNGNVDLNKESTAEINAYHTYYGKNTFNNKYKDENTPVLYASIDKNSAPGNLVIGDFKTYEDDTMSAPAITLNLNKIPNNPDGEDEEETIVQRIIAGNVFEDLAEEDRLKETNERLGNGIFDSNENVLKNVRVELLNYNSGDPDGAGSIAYIYTKGTPKGKYNEGIVESARDGKKAKAIVNTDSSGYYSIKGIVPGKYVLKFTYGDGSVIYKGNDQIKELKSADYYKSTIITSNDIKTALSRGENGVGGNEMWYKTTEVKGRHSDAVDGKEEIRKSNEDVRIINYTSYGDEQVRTSNKSAYSGPMNIKIELVDEGNPSAVNSETKELIKDGNKFTQKNIVYYTKNLDFGIIEKAKQRYEISKDMVNIKVTLANGQILINGDPRSQNIPYTKYLQASGDSRYRSIDIEVDSELLYGATLEVTYEIKAINKSESNYLTENYYKYGTIETNENIETAEVNHPETITFTKTIDYLDDDLIYQSKENKDIIETRRIENDMIKVSETDPLAAKKYLSDDVLTAAKKYNNILILQSDEEIVPIEMQKKAQKFNSEYVWQYKASRLLASSDDLDFSNDIESIEVETTNAPNEISTPGDYNPKDDITTINKSGQKDFYRGEIVITPPTGENKEYIIYIIAGVGFVILAGGIIIIKRKAL